MPLAAFGVSRSFHSFPIVSPDLASGTPHHGRRNSGSVCVQPGFSGFDSRLRHCRGLSFGFVNGWLKGVALCWWASACCRSPALFSTG